MGHALCSLAVAAMTTSMAGCVRVGFESLADNPFGDATLGDQPPGDAIAASNVVLGGPDATNSALGRGLGEPSGLIVVNNQIYVGEEGTLRVLRFAVPPSAYAPAAGVLGGFSTTAIVEPLMLDASQVSSVRGFAFDGTRFMTVDTTYHRALIWNTLPGDGYVPADLVLGQAGFTQRAANRGGGVDLDGVDEPSGAALINGRVFVVDSANHRVLVWGSVPSGNGVAADFALGQPNGTASAPASGPNRFNAPDAVASDGTRLYVADSQNHRVLIYDTLPTSNVDADLVLGQPDLTTQSTNNGGALQGLRTPNHVLVAGTRLYVLDSSNDRIVWWDPLPTATHQPIDGQVEFLMSAPKQIAIDGQRLYVSDRRRNRILVWDPLPADGELPAYAIGQPDLVQSRPLNDNRPGSLTLYNVQGVATDGTMLAAADKEYHRVVVWNTTPTSGQPMDIVLGQPDFESFDSGLGADSMREPRGVTFGGGRLIVSDTSNSRVLVYDTIATGASATLVLGQASFDQRDPAVGPSSMASPRGLWSDGTRLAVADTANHRVLLWDVFPTAIGQAADRVLGQATLNDRIPGDGPSGLDTPYGVAGDGTRLFVADRDNHRILVWDNFPSANAQPADRVIGQPDLDSSSGGTSARELQEPEAVAVHQGRILVADVNNHRVLIWNQIPIADFAPADHVLGQDDFVSRTAGEPMPGRFNRPRGLTVLDNHVWVADYDNSRIQALGLPAP